MYLIVLFPFIFYNYSIILNYVKIDMLTLDCKVTALSVEWMIILSMHFLLLTCICTVMKLYFRMILIAEKETVYKDFPTPLINRLEKHFVVTSTILTEPQKKIMGRLKQWAEDFTAVTKLEDM